jgi:beta-glucanase (GH16 family)
MTARRPKHLAPRATGIRRHWLVYAIVVLGLAVVGAVTGIAYSTHGPERPQTAPPRSSERPLFSSDFSATRLNSAVWSKCYPWMDSGSGCTNFGNGEYEWYLPSQVELSHGVLNLVAKRIRTEGRAKDGAPKSYVCRSGMVTTYPGFRFKYGYVRIVARLPNTEGLWSALWMAAASFKWPPEIDIIEDWGRGVEPTGVFFHPTRGPVLYDYPSLGDLSVGWHTFAVDWTRTELTWFIDGKEVLSTRQGVPQQPMYILADLAYTSTNKALIESGSGCHGTLAIKSIKVWRVN